MDTTADALDFGKQLAAIRANTERLATIETIIVAAAQLHCAGYADAAYALLDRQREVRDEVQRRLA